MPVLLGALGEGMGLRRQSVQYNPGHSGEVGLIGDVDKCPCCLRHLIPRLLVAVARNAQNPVPGVHEVYHCTNQSCGAAFIASYVPKGPAGNYALKEITPKALEPVVLPPEVAALSPVFVETYTQALTSESYGLTQLTGIGLRKSLEFLVKDFAVTEHETEKAAILAKPLAACIRDYISDASVKLVAERAAWLGNDETHYVRKWEERDLEDLKTLIKLVVNGIDSALLTKKYVREMPEGRK
jgi:hypothetical protein